MRNLHLVESPAAPSPLIERAPELRALGAAVRAGSGVVVLEAAAGLGKTALLDHAAALAADDGSLVRRAAPGPLERHFPYGVIRALLEAPLGDALDAVLAGADTSAPIPHGIYRLCSSLGPLVLVIDDAQWADRESLQVLAYLARRVEDLPLLILVAARAGDPEAPSDLLSLLGTARSAVILHPAPLTPRGAAQVIRRQAPDTPEAVSRECHRVVAGNPWLLSELGTAAIADSPPVAPSLRGVVRRRLAELTPRDRGVVEAMAVIGEGAAPHVVSRVAGVPVGELGPARDALLAAGLLGPGGERFAHGVIAAAVVEDLSRTERERLHREAARALIDGRADTRLIASHLLECGPQSDPEVSEYLLAAASEAAARGVPRAAAAYLERALSERAPGDDRGTMLAQLGTVTFDAGLPGSRQRLVEALGEVRDRESRIDVLTRLASVNLLEGGDGGVVRLFDAELAGESDPEARLAIEAAALDALLTVPERHAERARRVAAIDLARTADPLLQRVVLAHRAWVGIELGTAAAGTGAMLALEALEGGHLLREAHRRSAYQMCARVLVMADHPEAGQTILALRDEAVRRGSLRLRVAAAWHAAEHALRTGRVADAESHARAALGIVDEDLNTFTGGAVEVLVCALAERGAFDEARDLLRERGLDRSLGGPIWQIGIRHARARLALAEGDYERAHAEAIETGMRRAAQGRPNPSLAPWRATAALALAHLGRRDEASALADAELSLALRFGAPVPIAAASHARAVAEPDPAVRAALCERALADAPAGLDAIRLRLELGSALAYLGRRVEAREALRPALADADAAGAVLLSARARRELVATGLRPRQAALEGTAALTPRQRQICELAADGKGNRAIAQELFLSVKTVETHLAAGYRKLGVNTRAALAAELAAA
jgi:DNA-binding CsgD family transcriptional regulator